MTVVIDTEGADNGSGESVEQAVITAGVAAGEAEHSEENADESASTAGYAADDASRAAVSASDSAESATVGAIVASEAAAEATEARDDTARAASAIAEAAAQLVVDRLGPLLRPPEGEATVITTTTEGESQVEITQQDKPPRAQHWLERPVFGKRK